MIICGIEQPIGRNEMIKAAAQRGENLVTTYTWSTVMDPRLNRYSFVWLGYDVSTGYDVDDATAAFSSLLRPLLIILDAHITAIWRGNYFSEETGTQWWVDWMAREKASHEIRASRGNLLSKKLLLEDRFRLSEQEAIQRGREAEEKSQTRLAQLAREGWDTAHRGTLAIAAKQIEPSEYHYNDNRWSFLVLGPATSVQEFADAAVMRTMEAFPHFAPDQAFMLWLAEKPFSILYEAKDTVGRPGVIIVGKERIDIARLLKQGVIQRIEEDYEHAWRYPPDAHSRTK